MVDYRFDFLFIGGGILGSSGAYSLSKKIKEKGENASIAVIDIDLEGVHSSTLKNAGGVRATWRNRANIELCNHSIDFYERIGDEIQFRERGYFWMHGAQGWEEIRENLPLYEEYGLPVELYPTENVADILPFVDNLEGIAGLSISRRAGLIDHFSLREHYRREARERGVKFFDRCFVDEMSVENHRVKLVRAFDLSEFFKGKRGNTEQIKEYLVDHTKKFPEEILTFRCEVLVNTAGAWAPRISGLYGFLDEDVKPRRRQMVVMRSEVDISSYGMVIDTSDVYFHQEGENILAGYSNMDEPYGYNFDFSFGGMDEESQFVKYIWRPLWERSSKFERVKFVRGWAGIYGETPDRSGFLGKVPGTENIYECVAHTGRGLMISYGAGAALADLIVDGGFGAEIKHAGDLSRERPSGEIYEGLHL